MANAPRFILGVALLAGLFTGGVPPVGLAAPAASYPSSYLAVSQDDGWNFSPAVGYATQHSMYLVVWECIWPNGHHDIYGRLVNVLGQSVGNEFVIYSGPYNSFQPAVAYDTVHGQYLVVWAYDSAGDGLDNDIYGRFINWAGPIPSQTAFGIDTGRASTSKPRVAYGVTDDDYLVVWKVEGSPSYIAGGLMHDDQTGAPVPISSGPEVRDFPDVTYNLARNEYVAVWDEDVGRGMMDLDVYARRLAYDGTPQGSEFAVAGATNHEQHPTVAACGQADQYLFVWQQQWGTTSDDDLSGRWMTGSGVLSATTPIEGTTLPQQYPRVACNAAGTEYFLTWHDQYASPPLRWGIWAKLLHTDQTMDAAFEVVGPSDTRDRQFPAVAYGDDSALVAWEHGREGSGWQDIWAQVTWTHLYAITGLNVTSSSPTPLGQSTTLTATIQTGTFVTYTWGLGASPVCCASIQHYTFPAPGVYAFAVTATNGRSSQSVWPSITVDDIPLAANHAYATPKDTVLRVPAPGVLANATDTFPGGLTAQWAAGPTAGALVLAPTGAITYTPPSGFTGLATFSYRANDGLFSSAPAGVTILVQPHRLYLPAVRR